MEFFSVADGLLNRFYFEKVVLNSEIAKLTIFLQISIFKYFSYFSIFAIFNGQLSSFKALLGLMGICNWTKFGLQRKFESFSNEFFCFAFEFLILWSFAWRCSTDLLVGYSRRLFSPICWLCFWLKLYLCWCLWPFSFDDIKLSLLQLKKIG